MFSVMNKMNKNGKFILKPPENVEGADILHDYLSNKIDQETLIDKIKTYRGYFQK